MFPEHRGNTFLDVTVTGQWSSPSGCLLLDPSIVIDERIGILCGFKAKDRSDTSRFL